MSAAVAGAYVARWHSDEGCFTVIAARDGASVRVLVPGYPVQLRKLPATQERYLKPLDYPVRRAAFKLRKMALNNAGPRVRNFLNGVLRATKVRS